MGETGKTEAELRDSYRALHWECCPNCCPKLCPGFKRRPDEEKEGDRIPKGCVGPCKVQDYEFKIDVPHTGTFVCVSDFTRGTGLTHRLGKRVCVKSMGIDGKVWMDDNVAKRDHTNIITYWLIRDRRPNKDPLNFGQIFTMYDNEPTTAKIRMDLRDRMQVLKKFSVTVSGGPYSHKEQALIRKFLRVCITM